MAECSAKNLVTDKNRKAIEEVNGERWRSNCAR